VKRAVTRSTLLLGLLLPGCDSSGTKVLPDVHTSPDQAADPRFADVLAYMQREMAVGGVPGGSIAVVVDGKLAFQAGLGVERSGELTPVSSTTLFRVASLSKMVLAATALRLVETGSLDLSLPITTYLPSFRLMPPFDPSSISGQELLDHTAGIPDFDMSQSCPVGPGAMEQWFLTAGRGELWTPPGQVWNYTNQGYALAGWMIESAAGMSYEDAVARLVFEPAGMTTATFDPEAAMAEDHADGHAVMRGTLTISPLDVYDCEVTRPPGGVIASVVDYAHFAEMLLASGAGASGRVLESTSVLAMETGRADTEELPDRGAQYGDGLFVYGNYAGQKVVSHNGILEYGYQSSIWLVPGQSFAVVVFYNGLAIAPDNVSAHAIATFLEGGDASVLDGSTSPSTWQPYAGSYYDPFGFGAISVDLDGGQLFVSVPSLSIEGKPLLQQGGSTFAGPLTPSAEVATFYPGPCGPAQWFVTRGGVGSRVPGCDAGLDAP
jgi:CubicO group peptidase (beta-lactamase class C family)